MKSKIAIIGSTFAASAAALSVLSPGIHRATCATEGLAKQLIDAAKDFTNCVPWEEIKRPRERHTTITRPNGAKLYVSSYGTTRSQHQRRVLRFMRRRVRDKFERKHCQLRSGTILTTHDEKDL